MCDEEMYHSDMFRIWKIGPAEDLKSRQDARTPGISNATRVRGWLTACAAKCAFVIYHPYAAKVDMHGGWLTAGTLLPSGRYKVVEVYQWSDDIRAEAARLKASPSDGQTLY